MIEGLILTIIALAFAVGVVAASVWVVAVVYLFIKEEIIDKFRS